MLACTREHETEVGSSDNTYSIDWGTTEAKNNTVPKNNASGDANWTVRSGSVILEL